MDDLTPIAAANGGYLMRHQLNDLGLHDAAIRQDLRDTRESEDALVREHIDWALSGD